LIDPRAVIDPGARLADGVSIGAFSVIGAGVEIGAGTWIGPHVVINGPTRIGRDNKIYQFASIGDVPQDKKYGGEESWLEIGDRNVIREYCTMNRGTALGGGVTRVGNDNWIMAYAHIAHDCQVGNDTVFANNASIAGHVTVGDYTTLGAFTSVHQFCKIGEYSFSALGTVISKDVPPFLIISGNTAQPHGINIEGLKRRGFSPEAQQAVRRAYKVLYKSGLKLDEATTKIGEMAAECPELELLVKFLESSTRSIVR